MLSYVQRAFEETNYLQIIFHLSHILIVKDLKIKDDGN